MDFELEPVNLGYSTKNIPLPSKNAYLKSLISKTEAFLRNLRWKTFFFLNPKAATENIENYGFKSTKSPPNIAELKEFEDGLTKIIQNIEFHHTANKFQKKLSTDIDKINIEDTLLVPADKTTNFYKVKPNVYKDLLDKNITKDYKKASNKTEMQYTLENKSIASKLGLSDRIDKAAKTQAFVTLKDHKPNFKNKPTCRLINPCKTEIGKISKQILDRINTNIRQSTKMNQWKNSDEVISWYNSRQLTKSSSFICFDICDFYPSITEDLLKKALDYGARFNTISNDEREIILSSKKSLLFNNDEPWFKRSNSHFDVTMGSFDGAETCELVGLYLLSQLNVLVGVDAGLYRDDGLAICNKPPKQIEHIKKQICAIFAKNKLKITIDCNKKIVNFLDVTFNITEGTYGPYMKPNNIPLYVHMESNHPPSIIKNIPLNVNKRLNSISANKNVFDAAASEYQKALDKSGYSHTLVYEEKGNSGTQNRTKNKRNRTRNIIWFNPPFSKNVKTNVGKKFFCLLDKCFPIGSKLHKLLNRNTVKLSYSCMPNVQTIISAHNKSELSKHSAIDMEEQASCNCRSRQNCPLQNQCLTTNIIYQASVTRADNNGVETYIGLTENSFKTRYSNHMHSFNNPKHRKDTALSEYIWNLKDSGINYTLKWRIMRRARPYSTISKMCNLCTAEKFFIICKPNLSSLNKRNELVSTCRHRRKHLLCCA